MATMWARPERCSASGSPHPCPSRCRCPAARRPRARPAAQASPARWPVQPRRAPRRTRLQRRRPALGSRHEAAYSSTGGARSSEGSGPALQRDTLAGLQSQQVRIAEDAYAMAHGFSADRLRVEHQADRRAAGGEDRWLEDGPRQRKGVIRRGAKGARRARSSASACPARSAPSAAVAMARAATRRRGRRQAQTAAITPSPRTPASGGVCSGASRPRAGP